MTDHEHSWEPLAGERARYICACGRTGYRNYRGVIVAHKQKLPKAIVETALDVTRTGHGNVVANTDYGTYVAPGCGRVTRKPGAQ